jgi:hypothetical protein
MFALEKLKVYDKALTSAASLGQCSGLWDKRHSAIDFLGRIASMLRGLASRLIGGNQWPIDKVCDNVCD